MWGLGSSPISRPPSGGTSIRRRFSSPISRPRWGHFNTAPFFVAYFAPPLGAHQYGAGFVAYFAPPLGALQYGAGYA